MLGLSCSTQNLWLQCMDSLIVAYGLSSCGVWVLLLKDVGSLVLMQGLQSAGHSSCGLGLVALWLVGS